MDGIQVNEPEITEPVDSIDPVEKQFATTITCHTEDRESFKVDLGVLSESEAQQKILNLLNAFKTVREGDGILLQDSNGNVHIVNTNKVIKFEIRTQETV